MDVVGHYDVPSYGGTFGFRLACKIDKACVYIFVCEQTQTVVCIECDVIERLVGKRCDSRWATNMIVLILHKGKSVE